MAIKTLEQGLGFIKRNFNSVSAAQTASTDKGKIVFDSAHHIICVNGDVYGGNIQDASFVDSVLKIWKAGDAANSPSVTINFSDIASASQMMQVFQEYSDRIGLDSNQAIDYSSTTYLQDLGTSGKPAKNLVNADKLLDRKIKDINDAIAGMDGTAGIASENNGVVTIKSGIIQTNGEISNNNNNDITLAKVATTGSAEDVSYHAGSGSGLDATTVKGALDELGTKAISNAVTVEEKQTPTAGYLKSYDVKQGGVTVGTIDIPKDFLVKSASVNTVTAADKAAGGKFENDSNFAVGDKYIDFTINVKSGTATDEHIYLNVKDLTDVYTAQQNATQVQLAINANNVISATIVAGSIDTTELADHAVTTAKIADTVVSVSQTVPIIVANSSTATTLATVAGKDIKAKVSLFWDEWESGNGQG